MHLPEFILLVIATLAAIAAGLAVVVSNFRVARFLFVLAALSFGSLGTVWAFQSPAGYSLATQMTVAAVCAALAAAGLVWGLHEVKGRQGGGTQHGGSSPDPKGNPPMSGGKNVVAIPGSNNQVTIGHLGDVIIHQAPAPKLVLLASERKKAADGTFATEIVVGVESPYPPSRMQIMARASGVLDINIRVDGNGSMDNKQTGVADDGSYGIVAISSMSKRFRLSINTKEETDVQIEPKFE